MIIIAGGAGYLGSSISNLLADHGFIVSVITRKARQSENPLIHYFIGDVTDIMSMEKIVQEISDKFGRAVALISCVSGSLVRKPILSLSKKEFEDQFDINVVGSFNFFKSFCPIIIPGGFIIGITSMYVIPGTQYPVSGSYIPAKYALRGLLRLLSKELSNLAVKVYAIAPAFMVGGLSSDLPDKLLQIIKKKSTPDEMTTPDEVARVVLSVISGDKDTGGKMILVPGDRTVDL